MQWQIMILRAPITCLYETGCDYQRRFHEEPRLAAGDSRLPDTAIAEQYDRGAGKKFSDPLYGGAGPCGL